MNILFLTNDKQRVAPLLTWLKERAEENINIVGTPLTRNFFKKQRVDFIVSYNYRHIIKSDIISLFPQAIVNLHISLLPFNRGAHPNIWSFLDNTPKGVTIHYIDKGVDTGDILVQKEIFFLPQQEKVETLASTYERLHQEIQLLFQQYWHAIRTNTIKPIIQKGKGTIHRIKDFDTIKGILGEEGFDITIDALKKRFYALQKTS